MLIQFASSVSFLSAHIKASRAIVWLYRTAQQSRMPRSKNE